MHHRNNSLLEAEQMRNNVAVSEPATGY